PAQQVYNASGSSSTDTPPHDDSGWATKMLGSVQKENSHTRSRSRHCGDLTNDARSTAPRATQTSFIDGVQAPQVVFRPHCIFEVSPERSCHQRPRMSTSSEKLTAFHLGVTERPSRLSRLYCICETDIGPDGCSSYNLLREEALLGLADVRSRNLLHL